MKINPNDEDYPLVYSTEEANKPKVLHKIKCICCGKEVKRLEEDLKQNNPLGDMWNSGLIGGISAGYGSIHDGDVFFICICDNCITKKVKDGSLIYRYNYMEGGGDKYGISH